MGQAKKIKIYTYLAGPMEAVPDGGVQWRDRITPKLVDFFGDKIDIQDPCKSEGTKLKAFIDEKTDVKDIKKILKGWKESGHWEKFDPAIEAIIETDLQCVDRSAFIIVFLDFKYQMGGTISEITQAYRHRVPIYAVCYDKASDANSWILGMCRLGGVVYPNFAQAVEAITNDFKDYKKSTKRD